MTVRTTWELSRDLARNSRWPLFHAIVADSNPVSAMTVTWQGHWDDTAQLRKNVDLGVAHRIYALSRELDLSLTLFFVHRTLQPKSSTILHKKIWQSLQREQMPPGDRGAEIMVECGDRVRFASTAAISESDILVSVLNMPDFDVVVPVLLPNELAIGSTTIALEWTKLAFPPDGCREYSEFDWPIFAAAITASGGMCLRETSDTAGTVSVDFFAADRMGDEIENILSSEDELSLERRRRDL